MIEKKDMQVCVCARAPLEKQTKDVGNTAIYSVTDTFFFSFWRVGFASLTGQL